jgi:hypothetical protein
MVLTILPAGRGNRDVKILFRAHALGLVLGSFAMFAILALVGIAVRAALPESSVMVIVAMAIAALAWLPRSVGVRRGPRWPVRYWQVPQEWRFSMPLPATLLAYGFLLGLGVLTTPVLPVMWIFVAATVAIPSVGVAIFAWMAYATSRWIMTFRETRRALAADEVPDDVHGATGYRIARVLNVGVLTFAVACAAMQVQTLI